MICNIMTLEEIIGKTVKSPFTGRVYFIDRLYVDPVGVKLRFVYDRDGIMYRFNNWKLECQKCEFMTKYGVDMFDFVGRFNCV